MLALNNDDDGSNLEWLQDYLTALTMRSDWFFLLAYLALFDR